MAKKLTRSKRKANPEPRKNSSKTKTKSSTQTIKKPAPLSPAWKITWHVLQKIWKYRLAWLLVVAIYLALDLVLVRSVAGFDVSNLRDSLSNSLKHGAGAVVGGVSVFSTLMASAASGASAQATGPYHFFLVLLMSLVIIWLLRQMYSREGLTSLHDVRTAFYEAGTPFVPFIILIFWAGVQMLPLLIAMTAYSFMLSGGIATAMFQQIFLSIILFGVAFITAIWLVKTITALYIVTIPGMLPSQALQSAKTLLKGRRLAVMRKILFLPVVLFIATGLIIVPAILVWGPLAQWLFFILTGFGLVIIHHYLYELYRELLREED